MRVKVFVLSLTILLTFTATAFAQSVEGTYTGTMVGIGGRRTVTRPFTLTISGATPPSDVNRAVAVLAEGGQDALIREVRNRNLGRFSLSGQVGRQLNFVTETTLANGDRKIVILFDRWMNIYELRYGTRSTDYPFGYVELIIDRNGRVHGSFFPAARVRFDDNQVEVENFGVYPARLTGVRRRS